MREVTPLITSYTVRYVPGFEREDVQQELLEVLFRAQASYDPERGGFLNLLMVAFDRRMEWMSRRGRSQMRQITSVVCPTCDTQQPSYRWGPGYRCANCGSRKLDVTRADLVQLPEHEAANGAKTNWWREGMTYTEIGYELVEAADQFNALPAERRRAIVAEAVA